MQNSNGIQVTKRFEVTYVDKDTGLIRKEVFQPGSNEFNLAVGYASDPSFPNITGKYVDNSTQLGLVGKGKKLRIRKGKTVYTDEQVNYEIKDGSVRFIDFKPFIVLGYSINKRDTDDGDLLEVDLKKDKFAPVDPRETKDITYLLRAIQHFNSELLEEAENDDDEFDNQENDSSKESTVTSSIDLDKEKSIDNEAVEIKTYKPVDQKETDTTKKNDFLSEEEKKKNSSAFRKK